MFTVKFVDSQTFDQLPYKKVGSSIGVADRNRGLAYVRDTGNPMDVFTAYHELEHLKGEDHGEYEAPDEKGIYYKDMGSVFLKPFQQMYSASINNPVADTLFGGLNRNLPGGKKPQVSSPQPTMDQFNPQASATPPQAQAPNVVQAGGGGTTGMAGGVEQGTVAKLRELLASRQKGFYSGRDAGGV